jgi:hypothetical protein
MATHIGKIRGLFLRPAEQPGTGANSPHLTRYDFVEVAPDPRLSGFYGADEGVSRLVEMPGGVLILRRITTAHVPAFEAQPQVDPGIAGFDAVFADSHLRASDLDLIQV